MMRTSSLLAVVGAACGLAASPSLAGLSRYFVRADAAPGGDGQSWASAFDDVQAAIDAIEANRDDLRGSSVQIWVAQGVYTPSREYFPGNARSVTFDFPFGTAVFGGFWGDETEFGPVPPITERRYETTLSGDILGNDIVRGGSPFDDNAFHVVRVVDEPLLLDGVTIRSGQADGGKENQGGGVSITGDFADARLVHCRIEGNGASFSGGGVYADGGQLRIESCLIANNSTASGDGGGVAASVNNLIVVNTAFLGNIAFGEGSSGGGLWSNSSFATVVNSTFVTNLTFGVGAGGLQSASFSPMAVRNSVFWNNSGSLKSVELQQLDGPVMSVSTTCIQELGFFYSGENGNIGTDPLLMPISPGGDTMWNTPDDVLGYAIAPTSPCRNIGNNAVDTDASLPGVQPLPQTDLRGWPRIIDCNDAMPPATVDLGATEVNPGEPAYWIRTDAGSFPGLSNWLRFVTGENCNSAAFVGLDNSPLVSGVSIPGKFLAQPASIVVANAVIDMFLGDLSFLDATGGFAGIEGEIAVDEGELGLFSGGKGPGQAATTKVQVGDRGPASMSLGFMSLDVATRTVIAGPLGQIDVESSSVFGAGTLKMAPHAENETYLFVDQSDMTTDSATVGERGSALVEVTSLGDMQVQGILTLGQASGSSGSVLVDPSSSLNASGQLTVGVRGFGEFFNEGQTSATSLVLGSHPGGVGAFHAEPGSNFSVSGNMEIGSPGGKGAGPGFGDLIIHSPADFSGLVASVYPGSSIAGVGTLSVAVDNRGIVSPGLPGFDFPGDELVINDWYLQQRTPGEVATNSGSLVIDIGTLEGQPVADRLIVGDFAALGGGLYLRPLDGFSPTPGSLGLPVVEAASITGQFDVVFTPFFDDGRFLRVRYENMDGPNAAVTIYVDSTTGSLGFDSPSNVDVPPGSSASSAAVDFFNADPFIDLAVALPADDSQQLGCVLVLINQGNGGGGEWNGYTVAQCITVGHDPSSVATGDVNGDGLPDIITANKADNTVTILVNDGMGDFSFLPPITLAVGAAPVDVAAADVNNDSFLDIITANEDGGGVSVLFGLGGGAFLPAMSVPTGLQPSALTIADFDDAPGLEIAVANRGSGTITIIGDNSVLGIGGIVDIDLGEGAVPDDIDSGDIDNDKDIDVVASDQQPTEGPTGNTSGSVVVIRRDRASDAALGSGGGFASPVSVPAGDEPGSLALTDMDGDGDPDIAVVTRGDERGDAGEFIRLIRNDLVPNDGQLILSPWQDVQTGNDPTFVLPSDVNNDGLDDLVTLNIIPGGGLRGISTSQVSVLINAYEAPVVGDIDGDGMVSMADLLTILNNYNTFGIGIPGDVDNDGQVGFTDLNIVLSNFNQ